MIKHKNLIFGFNIFLSLTILFSSCENSPNPLGLNYIPPGDTLNTKIDTLKAISIYNFKKYINTYYSLYIAVGLSQNTISRILIKFVSIPQDYDSATVISAKLHLKHNKYSYQDSLGITSFNVYRINKSFNFSEVNYDNFSTSDIDGTILGTYTINNSANTEWIEINLNNQVVRDWFEYSADTGYAQKNYGIALMPNNNSTAIRGFYSYNYLDSVRPYINVIVNKNSDIDTFDLRYTESVTLSDGDLPVNLQDRFILQSGISFKNIIRFDISGIPTNIVINEALLSFNLDNANSFISSLSDRRVVLGMLTDSSQLTTDGVTYYANTSDTTTYYARLNPVFQKWISGTSANLGILMQNLTVVQNLDKFAFYAPNYSDSLKRPLLILRYTLKN